MAGPFVCGLVTSIANAVLTRGLGIDNFADGLLHGLIIGVGFLVTTTVNTGVNPNMPRPLLCGAVSGSYFLVAGVISSLILVLIR